MEHQLLATLYVESPGALYADLAVTARVQYQSGTYWYEDSSRLQCTVTHAHYTDETGMRRRYQIDVFRSVNGEWDTWYNGDYVRYYPLSKAGTHSWRLQVLHNNSVAQERMLYITIQPDIHVFVEDRRQELGDRIDLVSTEETTISQNPLVKQLAVKVSNAAEAVATRTLVLAKPNAYKETVFVKTNVPVDLVSDDLTDEMPASWNSRWVQLKDAITVTRKIKSGAYQWSESPVIQTDPRGKFVPFIAAGYSPEVLENPYYDPVELGLDKSLLALPLKIEAGLQLYARGTPRYTGVGAAVTTTAPIILDLLALLKTTHAITLSPSVITLDEDNNYTAFVAVEANDGAEWTFVPVDPRLTVTPMSSMGRAAVIVKKSASFNPAEPFTNIPLSVVSTVNAAAYPDIDGEYTVSSTAEIHIEQYAPVHNALIPRMLSNETADVNGAVAPSAAVCRLLTAVSPDAWKAFDHSLTTSGLAGKFTAGIYPYDGSVHPAALDNLNPFPGIEVAFDTPHRIRSWSLQSVGSRNDDENIAEAVATVLVLQGQSLDRRWKILDLARVGTEYDDATGESRPELYTARKTRIDRKVHHVELVDKIRIVALAVQGNLYGEGVVWFPQIQVFAGEPVIPKMQQSNQGGVQVRSNGGEDYDSDYGNRDAGFRVFDREVSGNSIAVIGSRAWYINNNHFLLEDVAENGTISQFGSFQSKAWLSIMFPLTRILGYLYSIDNLRDRMDNHANVSYAASLYFEGRQTADTNATLAPSSQWNFIDLVSLDHCIGHHMFGMPTENLVNEAGQTTINAYVTGLGLPIRDRTFLTNRTDLYVIRYDASTGKWANDGLRLAPGSTASDIYNFGGMTTEQLLSQEGQSRLNSVALTRGESMQPKWSTIPHKAAIVNQKDDKRMMYDLATQTWSEVPNNDAIYRVHDRTHYADLKDGSGNPLPLAQLRCTAQSIMNTEKPSVGGEPVAMPEVQFFGLPTEPINTGNVATITYLKAEDATGNLHDILGTHQRLRYHRWTSGWYGASTTTFRFYVGTIQNINPADKNLRLTIQTTSNTEITASVPVVDEYYGTPYREISVAGDYRTVPVYYKLSIKSAKGEEIILSSGYVGGAL